MGLFGAFKNRGGKQREIVAHFSQFVRSREGVAGYFEAETSRDPAALVLVAFDGEWTRRKIPSLEAAAAVCQELGINLYDVAASGYPRAMREWSAKNSR